VEEPEEWVGYAHALLKRAQKHSKGRFFVEPVDPEGLGIPDYFDIIKHPMDFGTIAKKLASNEYASQDEYEADMRLIFNNAFTYNAENDDVWRAARTMSNFFEENWTKSVGAPPLLAPARSESHPRESPRNLKIPDCLPHTLYTNSAESPRTLQTSHGHRMSTKTKLHLTCGF